MGVKVELNTGNVFVHRLQMLKKFVWFLTFLWIFYFSDF